MKKAWVRAAVAVSLLVVAILGWDAIRYDFVPKRLVPVDETFLYRSGQISEAVIGRVMDDYGFDTVIALNDFNEDRADHRAERDAAESRGVTWLNFPLRGNGTGDPENYVAALKEIHRVRTEGGRVLVHCASGVRRAAGVPSVYRVLVDGDPADAVYDEELDRFLAPLALWGPRPAHESRILPFLNENMEFFAQRLVEEGVIPALPDPIPQFRAPPSRISG